MLGGLDGKENMNEFLKWRMVKTGKKTAQESRVGHAVIASLLNRMNIKYITLFTCMASLLLCPFLANRKGG